MATYEYISSLIWGSVSKNIRRDILEKFFLDNSDLTLMNNNKMIRLRKATDITLTSSSIAPELTWSIHNTFTASDHYSITINITSNSFSHLTKL